jgi:hypothetical protein
MKPTAVLTIVDRGASTSYLLTAGGQLVWNTRANTTDAGRDSARERLRQWLTVHPYTVVLAEYQEEVASIESGSRLQNRPATPALDALTSLAWRSSSVCATAAAQPVAGQRDGLGRMARSCRGQIEAVRSSLQPSSDQATEVIRAEDTSLK